MFVRCSSGPAADGNLGIPAAQHRLARISNRRGTPCVVPPIDRSLSGTGCRVSRNSDRRSSVGRSPVWSRQSFMANDDGRSQDHGPACPRKDDLVPGEFRRRFTTR